VNNLESYVEQLVTLAMAATKHGSTVLVKSLNPEAVFAKVLTSNDDSSRHGVLIPSEAYDFFPQIEIIDQTQNATTHFDSFDNLANSNKMIAFKYYQRYPERRITGVNGLVNDRTLGQRLQVFVRCKTDSGESFYLSDCTNEKGDGRFHWLWELLTGNSLHPASGTYITVPITYRGLQVDDALSELLEKFDLLKGQWFKSQRSGDTGVGYTFETLMGLKENNDKTADFRGIELKTKRIKEDGSKTVGKVNLFQQGPQWRDLTMKAIDRIRAIGLKNDNGLHTCYSQITTLPNNLLLRINVSQSTKQIELLKADQSIGYWLHATLQKRLLEKHGRAAFILARTRSTKTGETFCYEQMIYCEQPSMQNFLKLLAENQLVFEFAMSEKKSGDVRNHGYPWRLVRESLLDQLFAVKVKIR
jgi:hypothetical protein